ncbi:FtsW/RodA/SpoVE family cell cycle protein [Adlercreutzia murintestinalis]|uniref:FtsW/RodA/SpoVE family cell cycle protein n=1 Tax=Adlercreutzia murintestinalis TaxID=2941325 RepID=UPI00203C4A1B|nr:FtsW/RodA/SpoVE family cell cycle protein [Adlercreutzia murintestinalis]
MSLPQIDTLDPAGAPAPRRAARHVGRAGTQRASRGPLPLSGIISWPFVIVAGLLVAYGLVICWSAVQGDDRYSFMRQAGGVCAGLVLMALVWAFDYRKLAGATKPLLVITVVLILSPHLPVIGVTTMGATSWINIGMQVQPGEFAKVTVVLFAASLVARYNGQLGELREYCKVVGLLLIPFICIMTQPDLGTGLVYLFISATVLVMGGARVKYLVWSVVLLVAVIVAVFFVDELLKYTTEDGTTEYRLLKNYQRKRLFVFMNQGSADYSAEGYNLQQAMIAIGSGGLFGKGLGSSTQSSLGFLPEAPTDFIFCVLAEELGFVGVLGLVTLYAVLVFVCLRIARNCGNLFGMLVVCAVVGMWLFQILENIGMCCGLMPITGIPLPFVSYGSSFMVVNFIMLGLIGSVYCHESRLGRG